MIVVTIGLPCPSALIRKPAFVPSTVQVPEYPEPPTSFIATESPPACVVRDASDEPIAVSVALGARGARMPASQPTANRAQARRVRIREWPFSEADEVMLIVPRDGAIDVPTAEVPRTARYLKLRHARPRSRPHRF